ncbi:hypothetical protein COEREDRAFT_12394 [Coemansia reversa NRRL 1564]|uniref:Uncharacterized protein n=1 Tax=Coemansia reversa (strain ATCC 12441 / NRRL 1564) TaxID=763665 RepID=A0A2G5B0X2_COERN|nr:hypothetical protein COEREDRAFT_12394 [Coemansia reversa NRRL 1564]|eukprot:PIA12663.1 hypothetical protein COEREDRAFT_12394 [Coemansia reversa NRRL 1564]
MACTFIDLTDNQNPPTLASPIPEWPEIMRETWRISTLCHTHRPFLTSLLDIAERDMSAVLYDPIAQNNAQGQVRSNTWPPVWHKVLEVMYSGILANNARPHPEYRRGDPLDAPLFFTRTFVIPTTNDWVTICRALYNIVLQDDIRGPYTQRLIPRLIRWLQTTVPETRGQQHCNDNLRCTLEHHMDTVALPNISSREITEARGRSHYSNWT